VWAERHGVQVRRIGTVANVDRRHMLCDLDRYVIGCPDHDRCALEVKTRSAWKADEWQDGGIPDDVEAQVMQQLAVTGLDAIHVAGLVGGQKLESRVILPDADYIADMFAVGDQFWRENVLAQVAPDISSLELLEGHLKTLTPDKGKVAELGEDEVRQVKHLSRIIAESAQAEAASTTAERELKAIIGADATDVVIDGETWWTWRSQKKPRRLDLEALAENHNTDVASFKAEWSVSDGTTRVLRKGKPVKAMIGADDE
jgi:predicted phage-related endonuclease